MICNTQHFPASHERVKYIHPILWSVAGKEQKMYTTFPAAYVELNRFETAALRMNFISNILVNILL